MTVGSDGGSKWRRGDEPPTLPPRNSSHGLATVIYPETSEVLRKGLLISQRSSMFSRWKERYFVLTTDYLWCFKRSGGKIPSRMGNYLFMVSLMDVEQVEWVKEGKSEPMIVLKLPSQVRLYLRAHTEEDIKSWLGSLQTAISASRSKRQALRNQLSLRTRESTFNTAHMEMLGIQLTLSEPSIPNTDELPGGDASGSVRDRPGTPIPDLLRRHRPRPRSYVGESTGVEKMSTTTTTTKHTNSMYSVPADNVKVPSSRRRSGCYAPCSTSEQNHGYSRNYPEPVLVKYRDRCYSASDDKTKSPQAKRANRISMLPQPKSDPITVL